MGLDWLGDYFVLVDSILEVRLTLKLLYYICVILVSSPNCCSIINRMGCLITFFYYYGILFVSNKNSDQTSIILIGHGLYP